MLKVGFEEFSKIDGDLYRYAVIAGRYRGRWIFCKHKERSTWEIPGGRKEQGEEIFDTAKRELYEETGASEFEIEPVCAYYVQNESEEKSYGLLCFAEITVLGDLPETEIGKIDFFNNLPDNLTYPLIQPHLHKKVAEYIENKIKP